MQRISRLALIFAFVLGLSIAGSPSFASSTGLKTISWVKVTSNGVMLKLEDFDITDVDANSCADPGQPYFYMAATEENYEEKLATVLTALSGGHRINIAYYACGNNPGVSPLLPLGNLTLYP